MSSYNFKSVVNLFLKNIFLPWFYINEHFDRLWMYWFSMLYLQCVDVRLLSDVLSVRRIPSRCHSRISGFFQCFQFSLGSSVGYQFEIQLDDCSRWFQLNVSNRERGSRIEGCRPSEIGSWFWRKRWREEKREERKIRTKTYKRGKKRN